MLGNLHKLIHPEQTKGKLWYDYKKNKKINLYIFRIQGIQGHVYIYSTPELWLGWRCATHHICTYTNVVESRRPC